MNRINLSFDNIGIIASTLCTIHCIATPFLFVARACSVTCCSDAPIWWVLIDYLFLVISFYAIFFIHKNLTIKWLRASFWISWTILLIIIVNQSIDIIYLPKNFIYIPSIVIVVLHYYNLKYCKCQDDKCCISI
ncbi:MAG: MerC domain-containing protein [Flavobacteriales bacterium]|nr:MerC domain-containing protein [Flavobacteriales bacterium]MDG1933795.1 MerC domain-containing protein [Flavobacteriales bacterium]MDG2086113.1 MerC domain-containing protein [Flavobacteriales bacterium]